MKKLIWILCIAALTACSLDEEATDDPIFCTTQVVPGLEVIVLSGVTNTIIEEELVVVVKDGTYTETLQNLNTAIYTGAFEREGEYTLTVSGDGYESYTSSAPIIVTSDVCHVITQRVEVVLQPKGKRIPY